jgi:hypothetical protein
MGNIVLLLREKMGLFQKSQNNDELRNHTKKVGQKAPFLDM